MAPVDPSASSCIYNKESTLSSNIYHLYVFTDVKSSKGKSEFGKERLYSISFSK